MARICYPGPARVRWTSALGLLAAAACILGFDLPRAGAADSETRKFTVLVDGKKAGDYQLNIMRQADGSINVVAASDVRVTILAIPVYTYTYRAREVWKAGRLQHFQSMGKEKSQEFAIKADVDGSTVRVQANGEERRLPPDVWPTSCWQLPDARYRNAAITLMGCDTGKEIHSRLEYVGSEKIDVAGSEMTCTHYRIMKDAMHDVWYDAQGRVVRDEWMSSGHKTVIDLVEVSH
jgi:hypothetical protein